MFNFFNEIKKDLDKLDLNGYNIVNVSGRLLYVEGHLGLKKISTSLITFGVKGGVVFVAGENLKLKELTEKTLKIVGKIQKIEVF